MANENKKRAGRGIKVSVSEDISHTGLSEEEYRILEEHIEEEERLDGKIRNSADVARRENFSKGLPVIYQQDGDIVYEFSDGTIMKKNGRTLTEILKERNEYFKKRNEAHIKEAREFLDKRRGKKVDVNQQDYASDEEVQDEMEYYDLATETMKDLWDNEEDEELSRQYDDRLNLSQEKWVKLQPNKSATEYYNEKRKERQEKREESKKKSEEFLRKIETIELRTSNERNKKSNDDV